MKFFKVYGKTVIVIIVTGYGHRECRCKTGLITQLFNKPGGTVNSLHNHIIKFNDIVQNA